MNRFENPLKQFMTQQALNLVGKQLGFSNGIPPQIIGLASNLLFSGMAKNVQSSSGADSLFNALNKDHANSGVLEKLLDFIPNARNGSGAGILGHVLGNRLDGVVTMFSQATGLKPQQAKQLLVIIAPIALAYMAKRMKQLRMNKRELAYDVRDHYFAPGTTKPRADKGLLMKMLDQDGDGQVVDDAVNILRKIAMQ